MRSQHNKHAIFKFLSLLLCLGFLSACAADDAAIEDQTAATDSSPQNIQQAPPEPQVEYAPVIDDPQYEIWLPGYWVLRNGLFMWVPGKIAPRPSPTAVWRAPFWMHHDYGWSFEAGYWE